MAFEAISLGVRTGLGIDAKAHSPVGVHSSFTGVVGGGRRSGDVASQVTVAVGVCGGVLAKGTCE